MNEPFVCNKCLTAVVPHPSSSRDHCNHCLWGQHVDIYPGDRLNTCRGDLKPIGLEVIGKRERIVYKCENCEQQVKCIVAPDDSRDEILQIASKVW